ncbi:hypothetical protein CC78DRAFT_305940 [Lojkania enalia]|uniref:Uncharacterized protein n=1 Tax=Lojkania enalia TaxID=147567 RepID=A0A9P4TQ34_9PLEO|nr:hypothetical protein CC78DRAFT_305940 [Didymosphaeria enalia]
MPSFYRLALLALPLLSPISASDPKSKPTPTPLYADANQAFQDLLNALPEESLHVALNSLSKFQNGVFESDRHGVEHVHIENPPLATKLIVEAVRDLKKRQAAPSNGTATPPQQTSQQPNTPPPESETAVIPSSPSPSPSPSPSSTEESAVIVPVPITTTDSEGRTTTTSSSILSKPTASVAVPITTTDARGSTTVSTTTKPAHIISTTDADGNPTVATSALDFAPTAGQVLTSTDGEGSTFLTTYTPGGGRVSSVVLITTTGEDGGQSVVTSYTYVEPAQATASDPPGDRTQTARPGLQTEGAGCRKGVSRGAIVGVGAMVGALLV